MTDVQSTRSWFSGAYTYHLAEADTFLGKLERYEQEMNHLLGTRFTIETLWELAPWSWLTDWFVDVGSFLGNLTALSSDRLVLRYGYVMNHQVATREHSLGGLVPKGTGPTRVANSFSIERKARRRATPYGFGLNVEQFSASRWAILGALGMTKSPRRLRGD